MAKLYVCSKNCGSIEESDGEKIPMCCGCQMKEVKENELFSCGGCAGCGRNCAGPGDDE